MDDGKERCPDGIGEGGGGGGEEEGLERGRPRRARLGQCGQGGGIRVVAAVERRARDGEESWWREGAVLGLAVAAEGAEAGGGDD